MAIQKIYYGKEARKKLQDGINSLSDAVISTLGPVARNVTIDTPGEPNVFHDGYQIAKAINLSDPAQNVGAKLIRQASSKTNDRTGDGTTTSVLLAQEISNKGLAIIDTEESKANGIKMKEGFEDAFKVLLKEIEKVKTEVKEGDILRIATISAQNEKIGSLIAEALQKVGKDGVVTIQPSTSVEMSVSYSEGMEFDSGYISDYFITNTKTGEAELSNVAIFLTDKKLSSFEEEVRPILEQFKKLKDDVNVKPFKEPTPRVDTLLVIAPNVEGEALAAFVINKMKATFNNFVVKIPSIGQNSKDFLEDLSVLTGATVVSETVAKKIKDVTQEDFGFASRVWADKERCQIIDGKGSEKTIEERVVKIKSDIEKAKTEHEKEELSKRIAKLTSGVGIIEVGATSEAEYSDIREKVVDGVSATRAAFKSGVVLGGGVTLLRIRKALIPLIKKATGDKKIAMQIIYDALAKPFLKIVENSGGNPEEMLKAVEDSNEENYGYNALTGELGNISEVLDPTLVDMEALKNAVSVSKMIITTDVLIVDEKEEEKK